MGNSNASELQLVSTMERPDLWKSLGVLQNYELLQNSETGEQVEQWYVHTGFKRTHEQQMREYLYRKMQPTHIVRVVFAEVAASEGFCTGSDKYRVWTERIAVRLNQVWELQLQQAMIILKEALIGYQSIYLFGKKATVTDEMIGLTADGDVKVWVNSCFGDNRPQSYGVQIRGKPIVLKECEIVAQVVQTLREHFANQRFPERLEERLNRELTFSEAIRVVSWYCREEKIDIGGRVPVTSLQVRKKPDTAMTFRVSPKETMSSGLVGSSKPSSPESSQVGTNPSLSRGNSTLQHLHTEGCHKPAAALNPVVNLQSKALQLKQQSSRLNKKQPTRLVSPPKIVEVRRVAVDSQPNSRLLMRSPCRDPIIVHDSGASRRQNLSNDCRMRESPSPSSRHILAHKNQRALERSLKRVGSNNTQGELPSAVKLDASVNKRAIVADLAHISRPELTSSRQPLANRANQSAAETMPIRRQAGDSQVRRVIPKDMDVRPEFSFNPNLHSTLRRPTMIQHTGLSRKRFQEGSPQPSLLSNSSRLARHFTGDSTPPTLLNVPMIMTIEGPPSNNTDSVGNLLPDESKFLQQRIREIEEQLKHITYLDSQQGSTPNQSQEWNGKSDSAAGVKIGSVQDAVVVSNGSFETFKLASEVYRTRQEH